MKFEKYYLVEFHEIDILSQLYYNIYGIPRNCIGDLRNKNENCNKILNG